MSSKYNAQKLLLKHNAMRCIWCEIDLNENNISMDHIVPVGYGGKGLRSNRKPCCIDCNQSRCTLTALLATAKTAKLPKALKKLEERKKLAEEWALKEREKFGFSTSDKMFAEYLAILGIKI